MNKQKNTKIIIRSQQINYHLQNILNNLLIFDLNYPIHHQKKYNINQQKKIQQQNNSSIIYALGNVNGLINTLKFIKIIQKQNKISQQKSNKYLYNISNYIFSRPFINNLKDQKIYWLVKNKRKYKLTLNYPKTILILSNYSIITIQRQCINLYQIQDDLSITLKDFDSYGLGKQFKFTQIKAVNYKQKQYVLIFGNEQQHLKTNTMVVIYEIVSSQLKFIKKSKISQKQTISPTIIFEQDPSSKQQQKFCLIIGGYQSSHIYHYYALKVDLYLLLNQFLFSDVSNTQVIPFSNQKSIILSGKAINYKDIWYCFCSEQQTINQLQLQYSGPDKKLIGIDIKSQPLNFRQKVYFSEDNMHYIYQGEEDKIVFLDKNLQLVRKQLNRIIQKIHN